MITGYLIDYSFTKLHYFLAVFSPFFAASFVLISMRDIETEYYFVFTILALRFLVMASHYTMYLVSTVTRLFPTQTQNVLNETPIAYLQIYCREVCTPRTCREWWTGIRLGLLPVHSECHHVDLLHLPLDIFPHDS